LLLKVAASFLDEKFDGLKIFSITGRVINWKFLPLERVKWYGIY